MSDQVTKAHTFKALHVPGKPIVLFNIWDAGSAEAVAASGVKALATGSWSVAAAHGFADGEHMPLDLALANLERIVTVTDLPVTIDLESGYGADPDEVGTTIARALRAGAIGCNIEDSFRETGPLREAAEQAARARGASALRLEVREDNAPARGLYERQGYRPLARIADYYEDGATALRLEKAFSGEARGPSRTDGPS